MSNDEDDQDLEGAYAEYEDQLNEIGKLKIFQIPRELFTWYDLYEFWYQRCWTMQKWWIAHIQMAFDFIINSDVHFIIWSMVIYYLFWHMLQMHSLKTLG